MDEEQLKKKKFCFFCENLYESQIVKEMAMRGYNIEINKLSDDADFLIAMGIESSFTMNNSINERIRITGNLSTAIKIHNLLDLPYWRLNDNMWKKYYSNYRKILEKADYIFGISNTSLNDLKKIWNLNGIRMFSYYMNKELEELKTIRVEKTNQIISIGRFAPNKRFEIILDALNVIGFKGKYLIIGPNDAGLNTHYMNHYKKFAEKYGIELEVKVRVPYKQLLTELKRSKLCVVPTIFEGMGHPSFESICADTEFLAADIPVKREFHKDTIHYAEADNVMSFAKKIKQILNDEVKMDFVKAKKQIEPFTVEACTDNFIKFLMEKIDDERSKTKHKKNDRYYSR